MSHTTSKQHGALSNELAVAASNGQPSGNTAERTKTARKSAGGELLQFTEETLQIAITAINDHFASLEIWKDPSIGAVLMQVADGTERVRRQFTAEMTKEPAEPRILVVDDRQDVLVAVGAFLSKEGYSIVRASDGEEALQLMAADPSISILVTDFVMPGLNGADLITQAQELRPDLRALVITGYPNADGLNEISHRVRILAKPFRRDALITAVGTLLRAEETSAGAASDSGPDDPADHGDTRVLAASRDRTSLAADVVARPAIDLVAEGMWRSAAGERCQETWEMLPDDQRIWWTDCAKQAVGGRVTPRTTSKHPRTSA